MGADFQWSGWSIAALRRMKAEGKSFSEIAEAIEAPSRSACIGKAHRLGIVGKPAKSGMAPGTKVARLPRVKSTRVPKSPTVVALVEPPPPELPPDREGVPFFDIRPGQCRWPLWGRSTPISEKQFCGEPVIPGKSYCPSCRALSIAPKIIEKEAA